VTHDQSEAMAMADRIAVLESGRLRQVATPAQLYSNPVDIFVADFIGNINAFKIEQMSTLQSGVALHVDQLGVIEWYGDVPAPLSTTEAMTASLAVRPEHVEISTQEPPGNRVAVQGSLGDIAFQGQYSIAEIRLATDTSITAIINNEQALSLQAAGEQPQVWAHWDINKMLLLPDDASASNTTSPA